MSFRIAFVTAADISDRFALSGSPHYMARALERRGGEVTSLGPMRPMRARLGRLANAASRTLLGRRYDWTHSPGLSRTYGRLFGERLREGHYDVALAPYASSEIAFLETELPVVYVADATFALLEDYLTPFSNLLRVSTRAGHLVERHAIQRSDAIVYPTRWAADSAMEDYGADPAVIEVIPFGANMDEIPERDRVLGRSRSRACRLLLVGRDWEGKGGRIALDALRSLEAMGVDATLTVCGCRPPAGVSLDRIRVFPHLDKNDPEERRILWNLYLGSDFLIVPTRAEAYGLVFCEASAFALPAITTRTGGVPWVVRDGVNGYCLPLEAEGQAYAERIAELHRDVNAYESLRRSSRERFERELNWNTWAERMFEIIEGVCRSS